VKLETPHHMSLTFFFDFLSSSDASMEEKGGGGDARAPCNISPSPVAPFEVGIL
jgi:hypothetical protein